MKKLWLFGIVLLILSSFGLADFTESDNFDDNSINTSYWTTCDFTEQNQQMEEAWGGGPGGWYQCSHINGYDNLDFDIQVAIYPEIAHDLVSIPYFETGSSDNAPILYAYGASIYRYSYDNSIRFVMRNNSATISINETATDTGWVYFRIKKVGTLWTGYYGATDDVTWTKYGEFSFDNQTYSDDASKYFFMSTQSAGNDPAYEYFFDNFSVDFFDIFSITSNGINGTAMNSFSAYYTNNGTLIGTTTNGEINTSRTGIQNITLTSNEDGGYFNKSYLNQPTSTDLVAEMYQVQADFIASNILSKTLVSDSNFSDGTKTGTTLYFNAGTYNITFFNQSTEHYNKTQEFTYSALDNVTSNLTGVYNHLLNVTAFLITNNSATSIFDINVTSVLPLYNLQYLTTNGEILVGLEQDYNFSILLNHNDYALSFYNTTPTNISDNYQFQIYTSNSFNFTFLDETNNATVTELVNVEFISSLYSYNYSTSTGYLYVDLLVPATYTIRYSSANYGRIREFYYTLTNQSHQEITLYLINDGNSTAVTVNVYDKLTVEGVQNAVVQLQRYSALDNAYQTIAMYSTDVSGTAYFDVEADNEYYKILVDFPYLTRKYTSEPFYISATTYNVYISLIEEIADTYFEEQGIVSSINYNNETDTFTASWTDSALVATQYCLELKKYGIYSLEILGTACSVNPISSLSISGLSANTTNYAVLSATINGEKRILNSAWISTVSDELDYGTMGAFMSLIIVGVFALLVSFHSLALILGAVGLIFSKLLGLLPLSWGVIIAVTILAVILNLIINLFKK